MNTTEQISSFYFCSSLFVTEATVWGTCRDGRIASKNSEVSSEAASCHFQKCAVDEDGDKTEAETRAQRWGEEALKGYTEDSGDQLWLRGHLTSHHGRWDQCDSFRWMQLCMISNVYTHAHMWRQMSMLGRKMLQNLIHLKWKSLNWHISPSVQDRNLPWLYFEVHFRYDRFLIDKQAQQLNNWFDCDAQFRHVWKHETRRGSLWKAVGRSCRYYVCKEITFLQLGESSMTAILFI